jgi:hypothetical protein
MNTMDEKVNKLLQRTSATWLNLIIGFLYIVLLIASTTSCETEAHYKFSDAQLERAEIYSVGEQFLMANSSGDTLTFAIDSKEIKKVNNNPYGNSWQKLTYYVKITTNKNDVYNGNYHFRALPAWENLFFFSFDIKSNHINGSFRMTRLTDTVVVNGVKYPNAACSSDFCFSSDHGFLKIFDYQLIP